ncbi:MAG: DMT family transporter [Pseudomonadota bacterium]
MATIPTQGPVLMSDQKKGILIATAGGLLLACDIPLVLLANTDPWTTIVVRGPIMAAVLLIVSQVLQRGGWSHAKFYTGRDTLILGMLHAIATVGFVLGIFYTTTANLVFITAFSSLIALVLSTVLFKERHPLLTWVIVLVALCGIVLITIDDMIVNRGANTFGNLMALLCAFMLATEVIFIRRSRENLVYAPAISGLLAALFALPFVLQTGLIVEAPLYLILNSMIISPLAMALLTLAPRYITAPETAMFYLLETVFAPVFVWAIFAEVPTSNTVLGGMIVIAALLFHSYTKLQRRSEAVISRP